MLRKRKGVATLGHPFRVLVRSRRVNWRVLSYFQPIPSQSMIWGETFTTTPVKTTLTMHISLIRMFKLGPEVSLNGSPTVSPMTAAP